ncbi:hypothetical protein V6N13_018979 [Hibiscus sabdariffa]|uniref:Uncharacterized protein n=1 Tax=Hibiscus sabdariffa TaxID=183260 RepID=A0ABR2EP26_9ROSI
MSKDQSSSQSPLEMGGTPIDEEFLVVDQPSTYNAIFMRPLIRKVKLILATFSLTMKFPYTKQRRVHKVRPTNKGMPPQVLEDLPTTLRPNPTEHP